MGEVLGKLAVAFILFVAWLIAWTFTIWYTVRLIHGAWLAAPIH